MPNQLSPKLPAKNKAHDSKTLRQAILRSDRPGAWAGPVNPRFSESIVVVLGVAGSAYESRLDTTREGIANLARLVKNASLGVESANIPETFAIA
jgi:hypothetical protein